eukprot:sb/3466700/
MDCVGVLRSEYGKVACKHEDLIQGADAIDKLLDPAVSGPDYLKQVKFELSRISQSHKDWHGSISRFGKAIDKQMTENVAFFSNTNKFRDSPLIQQLICEHFLRQGDLDLVSQFIKESGYQLDEAKRLPFVQLHEIVTALKAGNLAPAMQWCETNRTELKKRGSLIEFLLHRRHFISLVQNKKTTEALRYAKILEEAYSMEICDMLTKEACSLLGLSKESPLAITVDAGCKALPALNAIKQVMEVKQLWELKDELPCEVELGPSCQFHTLLACPILRAQCTKTNPPMRLECGHVISNDALKRLTMTSKVKCPYCPQETSPTNARELHF